jgi:hypothetical protein
MPGPEETAAFLLKDLERWTFGELLARRARWDCTEYRAIEVAVQAYRLAIMQAVLKATGSQMEPLALAVEQQEPLDPKETAPYTEAPAAWEAALAGRFLERMRALAPFGEAEAPLTRFAHGQYFKYSRRISYLLKLPPALPASYAPAPAA